MCAKSTQCNNLYSCLPPLLLPSRSLLLSCYIMTLTIYCPRFVVYSDDVGGGVDDAAAAASHCVVKVVVGVGRGRLEATGWFCCWSGM